MKKALLEVFQAVVDYLEWYTWDFTNSHYDYDHYKEMQDPDKRKAYSDAMRRLRDGEKVVSFTLKDGEKVKLCRSFSDFLNTHS